MKTFSFWSWNFQYIWIGVFSPIGFLMASNKYSQHTLSWWYKKNINFLVDNNRLFWSCDSHTFTKVKNTLDDILYVIHPISIVTHSPEIRVKIFEMACYYKNNRDISSSVSCNHMRWNVVYATVLQKKKHALQNLEKQMNWLHSQIELLLKEGICYLWEHFPLSDKPVLKYLYIH